MKDATPQKHVAILGVGFELALKYIQSRRTDV
jgi:hypothetical protein